MHSTGSDKGAEKKIRRAMPSGQGAVTGEKRALHNFEEVCC
jgi:hypothetical protein